MEDIRLSYMSQHKKTRLCDSIYVTYLVVKFGDMESQSGHQVVGWEGKGELSFHGHGVSVPQDEVISEICCTTMSVSLTLLNCTLK